MTKIQNPIIGRSSGQAGNMVFSKMYDKNVIRSKSFDYKDANTPVQILNREVAEVTMRYAKSLPVSSLVLLYPRNPISHSRFAALLSQLQTGRDISGPHGTINLSNILSFGNGLYPAFGQPSQDIGVGVLTIVWDNTDINTMSELDPIYILLFDTIQLKIVLLESMYVFGEIQAEVILADLGLSETGVIAFLGAKLSKSYNGKRLSSFILPAIF